MSGHNFGINFLHVQPEATFKEGDACLCICRRVYMMIKEIEMLILIHALPITLKGMVVNTITDNIAIHSQGDID